MSVLNDGEADDGEADDGESDAGEADETGNDIADSDSEEEEDTGGERNPRRLQSWRGERCLLSKVRHLFMRGSLGIVIWLLLMMAVATWRIRTGVVRLCDAPSCQVMTR